MTSDHSPTTFVIPKAVKPRPKPFKFQNYLTEKDGFIPAAALVADPHSSALINKEVNCLKAYRAALKDEESFLKQKSKTVWLKKGDMNSKYFHNVLRGRLNRGRIYFVEVLNGVTHFGNDVGNQFLSHFQNVLGKCSIVRPIRDPDSLFLNKLSYADALFMIREISDDEVKNALFDIDGNKAPEPDGFSSQFFKAAWSTVGGDICKDVKEFFKSGKLLKEISDNILLAQELMRGYHSKRGIAKCAFKIDIQKAYDYVEWKFMESCLINFGFHKVMIKWIMECVTSTSFSININGELQDFFKGKKGLRQGDPLSPYLFTLVMEVLNLLIKRHVSLSTDFKYHWQCKELKITHICFANDLLIFCHRDSKSVSVLKSALDDFGVVSGLLPCMPKSTMFFGNVKDAAKSKILKVMPLTVGTLPVRYLGVLLISNRIFSKDCQPLIDKRLMRDFLWNFGIFKRGKAKVKWSDVCKPKVEGSLGIRSLEDWNIHYSRLSMNFKIADVIDMGRWIWPNTLTDMFDGLLEIDPPSLDSGKADKLCGRIMRVAEAARIWDFHVKRGMGKKKDMGSFQVVGWLMEDFCYQEMLFYGLSDD
ncbi:polypyrimidine tract-binding protein homolog 2 isoform X1 [Tanacetum coccineum]